MKVLRAYTDGSCVNQKYINDPTKPRFAGIGVFFRNDSHFNVSKIFNLDNPTNIRAEIIAAQTAMKIMKEHMDTMNYTIEDITYQIYTDCQLVIDTFYGDKYRPYVTMWKPKSWKPGDGADGWMKKDKTIPQNLDIIIPTYELFLQFPGNLHFCKVKAHTKAPPTDDKTHIEYKKWYGNMMADILATEAPNIARNDFVNDQ